MNAKNQQNAPGSTPLAIALPVSDLKGWFNKSLDVPPGRQGIGLFRDGKVVSFEAGAPQVLRGWTRFQGNGAGFWAGYVPNQPFNATLSVENLVSADHVLVDLSLLCTLKVTDAKRFFVEEVIPRRTVASNAIFFDKPELFKMLSNYVRNFTAQDLIDGMLDADLDLRARKTLETVLSNSGLGLDSIDMVTCWRKDDRLLVEKQIQTLEQQMADLEFEKKLSEMERDADLLQLLQETGVQVKPRFGSSPSSAQTNGLNPRDKLSSWLASLREDDKPGENFRVKSLVAEKSRSHEKQDKTTSYKPLWWLPRAIWMSAVVLIASGITVFLNKASETRTWLGSNEFYIAIWMFVLGVIIESAAALFKGWEKWFEQDHPAIKHIGLDQLKIKDRNAIDQLVKDQCRMELVVQKEILNELRGRVYQSQDMDTALELKRLEAKVEDFVVRVKDNVFGSPPYVREDLRLSKQSWNIHMENEELLLINAALLSEEAHEMQHKFNSSKLSKEDIKRYETNLDGLYKSFALRERVLQSSDHD